MPALVAGIHVLSAAHEQAEDGPTHPAMTPDHAEAAS
jgi:hypothetical protein